MSESFMRSTLAKSLLIDFFLTSICLSHRDDSCSFVATRSVSDHDRTPVEQAQGDQPFLSIIEAAVDEGDAGPFEHVFGIGEIQAMFA